VNFFRRPLASRADAAIVFSLALLFYCLTLAPGLTFIDSGELATVAVCLGIAHPTGYPLFTLLGRIAAYLPLGGEEILRLNLLAAVFCAGAAVLFYFLTLHLLVSIRPGLRDPGDAQVAARTGATGAALLLAFSETFWSQAVAVEVYSLHLLLLGIVLLMFFTAILPSETTAAPERRWLAFAFALGLSFSNHMTTILLAPGLLFLYFATQGSSKRSWGRIGRMSPFFLLGLSPYLYLPLRASQVPFFNWGAPATAERFLWHVSGRQYRVWMFSSTASAGKQLNYFVSTVPSEVAYIGLVLALLGIAVLFRLNRHVFWGTLLLFAACVGYSINYDIHDIDSYFLLAYVMLLLWSGFGIAAAVRSGMNRWHVPFRIWRFVGLSLAIPAILVNYPRVDLSGRRSVEEYAKDMFASVAPNALVFSYQWDYWVSASLYMQYVRGYRPDVAVVDKELLRRSWYLQDLERRYPWLIERSRAEVDAFRRELYRFEHELPYNPSLIQTRFEGMIRSFIGSSLESRPVYVTPEIEPEFTRAWQRVPEGLAHRLYADSSFHPTSMPSLLGRPLVPRGAQEQVLNRLYADAFCQRAQYYYSMAGYSDEVNQALNSALLFDKSHQAARRLSSLLPPRTLLH
jgi:hypothetical protein